MPEAGERAASAERQGVEVSKIRQGLRTACAACIVFCSGPQSLCLFAEQSPLSPWPVPEPSGLMHSLAQVTLCTSSL